MAAGPVCNDSRDALKPVLQGSLLLAYYLDATGHNTHKTLALYHSGNTRANHRNGLYLRAVLWLRDYFYHHPCAGL